MRMSEGRQSTRQPRLVGCDSEGTPMIRALVLAGLLSFAPVLATEAHAQTAGPSFPNPGKTSMSKDNQHALGMEAAAQVFQQMPVLPDYSEESQYIRQLGKKLVATIPPEYSWPYEFH